MDSNVRASTILEPHNEMEFESHEAAYEFYREYAKTMGFGTAKLSSRRSRASKEFIDAKFSCIRYGNKQQSDDALNPRPSPKIGCKASMHVKRGKNGKWYVHSVVKEHNHELLPAQAHFFRSHRNTDLLKSDVRLGRGKSSSGMSKLLSAYQSVHCMENYLRSHHDKGRSLVLEHGDAQLLLEFFMQMQEGNPKFFYAIDLNEEHRLRNVFWVDPKGMEDYSTFSDVVFFDTSYFTNKYKLPLAMFIGVNNHIQPTVLGCALIADETVYTFFWLMQTWLVAMGEQAPRIILTDQSNALKAAVGAVFPETRHCFSLWHVLEKIPRELEYYSPWHDSFMVKFNKCINRSWTEEQFDKRWRKLLDRFSLTEVEWVQTLYEDRRYWVPAFMRDVSFAGLSSASRSSSLNSFFDKYIQPETTVREFIEQYQVILEDMYEDEANAEFDAWHETPELKSPSPFEKQLLLVYTHKMFQKFQVEVLGAAACHLKQEEDTSTIYTVKDFEDNQIYIVEWNQPELDIYCSCRSFEYKGYICRHAIVVLQMSGVFMIPSKYILQRWTNAAKSRYAIGERLEEVQQRVRRFNDLCRRAIILGEEGSLSQKSYKIAVGAIKEALKQCANVNNSVEKNVMPNVSLLNTACSGEEENRCYFLTDEASDPKVTTRGGTPGRREGKGRTIDESHMSKKLKGPQPVAVGAGTSDAFQRMGHSGTRAPQLQNMLVQLHNMGPTAFHNVVPTQFNNGATAHLYEDHHPP